MNRIETSTYELAQRYVGTKEVAGTVNNPLIMAMLRLDAGWPEADEVPWCSAFANWIAWNLRVCRSKSLRARSWLLVGECVDLQPDVGMDVVILQRGGGDQPGADVIEAPGHVGFFGGFNDHSVMVLGGNQGDTVSLRPFPIERVLGFRRLGR